MALNTALLIHQFKRKDYEYVASDFLTDKGTYDRQALVKEARRQAKAMNQRLLRLERAGLTNAPAYRGAVKALSGAYSKDGEVSFGHIGKGNKPRYKEKVDKLSNDELLQLLYATSKTSQARTSTQGVINKLYGAGLNRLQSILKDTLGESSEIGMSDMFDLFKSEAYTSANKLFGYKAVLQVMADAREAGLTPEQIKTNVESILREHGVPVTKEERKEYKKGHGKSFSLLDFRKAMGLKVPELSKNWQEIN